MIRNRYRKRSSKKSKRYRQGKGIFTIPAIIAGALAAGKAAHLGSKLAKKFKVKEILDKIKKVSRIGIALRK